MEDARLTELVDAWLDDRLTDPGKQELEQTLISSASARRQFWEQAALHAALHEVAKLDWMGQSAPAGQQVLPSKWRTIFQQWFLRWSRRPFRWAVAAAACISLLVFFGSRAHHLRVAPVFKSALQEEEMTAGVAMLTHAVNVDWKPESIREVGAVLDPGRLQFNAGLVRIDFYSGARLLLEGPADLQLISRTEAFCRRGKLSAEVPPQARGFRIGSPQMTVIDLGTAFGLDVSHSGAEMHVFSGEVQLSCPGKRTDQAVITEGHAVAVDGSGQLLRFTADVTSFVSLSDLEQQSSEALRQRYTAWRNAAGRYRSDPALLLYFDFEGLSADRRSVLNRAQNSSRADGVLVGCEPAEGRWPGKRALEWKRISDRVRVSVGGEFESVTLFASVRVDSIQNKFNSLMLSDGFELGGLHWQITRDGFIRLGLGNGDPKRTTQLVASVADYDSPVVITPERIGQWVHLAVVYDAKARTVAHYVDGNPVSVQKTFNSPRKIRIDAAEIGNWNNATGVVSSCPIRNFCGRMDEFGFFARALSSSEIRRLYEHGSVQPPRALVVADTLR